MKVAISFVEERGEKLCSAYNMGGVAMASVEVKNGNVIPKGPLGIPLLKWWLNEFGEFRTPKNLVYYQELTR